MQLPPPVVSGRALAITGLAVGAAIGLAVVARQRRASRDAGGVRTLADRVPDREQPIQVTEELLLERSSELSALDGGYDVTAPAAPSTTVLR